MPDLSLSLAMVGQTDTGLQRAHNEDAIAWDSRIGLVVLADGMGGYNAGEVASAIAVKQVSDFIHRAQAVRPPLPPEPERLAALLTQAVWQANDAVYTAANSHPQYAGMGTTIVVAFFQQNRLAVAHVGDSRLYRLRAETLKQLTHDHSFLQEQIDLGLMTEAEADETGQRNLITRAVGIGPEVEVEVHVHDIEVGDLYLLCSDGLTDEVDAPTVVDVLTSMRTNLPMAAAYLIQEANNGGGKDNISVVLADIKRALPGEGGWCSRIMEWLRKDG